MNNYIPYGGQWIYDRCSDLWYGSSPVRTNFLGPLGNASLTQLGTEALVTAVCILATNYFGVSEQAEAMLDIGATILATPFSWVLKRQIFSTLEKKASKACETVFMSLTTKAKKSDVMTSLGVLTCVIMIQGLSCAAATSSSTAVAPSQSSVVLYGPYNDEMQFQCTFLADKINKWVSAMCWYTNRNGFLIPAECTPSYLETLAHLKGTKHNTNGLAVSYGEKPILHSKDLMTNAYHFDSLVLNTVNAATATLAGQARLLNQLAAKQGVPDFYGSSQCPVCPQEMSLVAIQIGLQGTQSSCNIYHLDNEMVHASGENGNLVYFCIRGVLNLVSHTLPPPSSGPQSRTDWI